MSKVVLINRPIELIRGLPITTRKWPPLNLLYISTYLKNQGLEVEIIDARALDYNSKQVGSRLAETNPEIIFIASDPYDLYQCPTILIDSFYEIISIADRLPSVKYILSMGPQATIFDEKLLSNTALDYIIKGDDPITAAKLIIDLVNNKKPNYPNISFIKEDNNIEVGQIKHLENLDELPVGDYSLLPMDKYSARMKDFPKGKFSIMTTSRGCPASCKFCFKKLIGSNIRQMSLPRVKEELDELVRKNGVKNIFFMDEFFSFDYQRVIDLSKMIIEEKYNIFWGCQTRPDRVSQDLLVLMKEAGCHYISYGVESGSPSVLERSKKSLDLKKASETIKITRQLGITPHVNMLYGYPGETAEEFNQSINFLLENAKDCFPCAIVFFPETKYYQELIPGKSLEEVKEISLDLSLTNLTRNDINKGLAKLALNRKLANKEYSWKIIYFLTKYLFPGLIKRN